MWNPLRTIVGISSIALCSGCVTSHRAGMVGPSRSSTASDAVIASELTQGGLGQSLLAALQAVRPGFLTRRGTAPLVSIDGGPSADQSVLRMIPVGDVQEVRLVRSFAGAVRSSLLPNGDVVVGDVLLVVTRRR
jgi:hypothetical protein